MYDNDYMSILERYRIASSISDDPSVRLDIQTKLFYNQLKEQQEEEKLLNRLAERLAQSIKVSADVKDAIMQIEELKKALDSLGN